MFAAVCTYIDKSHAHALKRELSDLPWYHCERFLQVHCIDFLQRCLETNKVACARVLLYEWNITSPVRQSLVNVLVGNAHRMLSWSMISVFVNTGGVHLCARDVNGDTFLHTLADAPFNYKIKLHVQRILELFPAVVFLRNANNETPLMRFCRVGNYGAVKRLIKAGSDIDDNVLACAHGHPHIFRELQRQRS